MKKILYALLLVVPAFFTNCNFSRDRSTIKVGVILPLTGSLSKMGEMERNAMVIASEHLYRDSMRSVELIFEDNKSRSVDAVSAANKLLTMDNVDMIVSSTTGASLAIQPIVDRYNIPHVAFCMDTEVSSLSKNTIRYYMGLEQEISAILDYLSICRDQRIGVLCCKIPAYETLVNKYIKPYFISDDNALVYLDYYELNQTDFKSIVLQLKKANLHQLILLGYGFEYYNIYRQLVEQDVLHGFQILGGWGFLYTDMDAQLLEGTLVAGPEYVFENNVQTSEFKHSYYEKFGSYPNFDAAFSYELILNIPSILSAKGDLKEYMSHKKVEKSLVGGYTFDSDGNMLLDIVGMGEYKDGNIESIFDGSIH